MFVKQNTRIILQNRLHQKDYQKINTLDNPAINNFIATSIEICNPEKIFIATDSSKDIQYTREAALRNHEEKKLTMEGHTIHFDGYLDQARDKAHTKFLLPRDITLGPELNTMDRDEGLKEIVQIMTNIMASHELFIKFYCLGPTNSPFSIPCIQLTDSAYVAHSEDLLYRQGYQEFVKQGKTARFFKFVHSQGELEKAGLGLLVSKNVEKRRVYIDLQEEIIYSMNTQYGGNSLGLKKLAMRLAINRCSQEHWLVEHMLFMGVHGPRGRISYFTGAFPSMCGKTSTAMMNGETIIGDDIAFLRKINGTVRAVNVESGIFGIIEGINDTNDPIQWDALTHPAELIFSNILVTEENDVYWNGKPGIHPETGVNYSGKWRKGNVDTNGKEIPPSHKNARFTLRLDILPNVDPLLHDPNGVEVHGIIYGGRDSDTSVPVEESFNWTHGIITKGACLESETTAATLGTEGIRVFNPMSNIDFLSIPIGRYIQNNLDFGGTLKHPPRIFAVNYFLKERNGSWLNEKNDKAIWLKWMELRVNKEADAITTPTGYIPIYSNLKTLFTQVLHKHYSQQEYNTQFTIRTNENLAKITRMRSIFQTRILDTPPIVFTVLNEQEKRLIDAQRSYGEYITPEHF
ncbi:MAG: phosphoenolpyruvate carboxykinase (GTP) [Thermoplasmata archaeon]|nr:phosphoenolpyruvate carboxykinase (GTP) [Actinomycetota bacterium]MBE3139695.1 phosphoenolpyruvate carboxykinase (GTP) [Thermoplasmata archaeon]